MLESEPINRRIAQKVVRILRDRGFSQYQSVEMNKDDYKRAYAKGYCAGRKHSYPEHLPPMPPNQFVTRIISALIDLRNAVDGELAKYDAEDEIQGTLGGYVDRADEALAAFNDWTLDANNEF